MLLNNWNSAHCLLLFYIKGIFYTFLGTKGDKILLMMHLFRIPITADRKRRGYFRPCIDRDPAKFHFVNGVVMPACKAKTRSR